MLWGSFKAELKLVSVDYGRKQCYFYFVNSLGKLFSSVFLTLYLSYSLFRTQ